MIRVAFLLAFLLISELGNSNTIQRVIHVRGPEDVDFTIFPNPFRENITLHIQSGTATIKSLRITNLIGKEIFELDLSGKSGSFSQKFDFETLEPGIYFFTLYTTKGAVETKKVVKLR